MRVTLEGEARFGGRWGKLEVDLKLGSPTSAAALLSELLRSKLISGARVHNHNCFCVDHRQRNINWPTFAEISPRVMSMFAGQTSARTEPFWKEARSVAPCVEHKGNR